MAKTKTVNRSAKLSVIPRTKKVSTVSPTSQKGQIGQSFLPYLFRYIPVWNTPSWYEAKRWRALVRNQPIAMACKETLQSIIAAMDWTIVPRDTSQVDELKKDIDYYTKLFTDDGNYDFVDRVEWLSQDILDIPFGAAAEIGREGDSPTGRVRWIVPLDGGTLFPTLDEDAPVGQIVPGIPYVDPVYFPKHAINRVYMTPRTEIERAGWGMAPPEKIYLALEMLWRGDQYYANLLLDTPEAGILDLGDMAKDSAEQWVESFRNLMTGVDPFKIPVLYEHEKEVKYIPFGRPPADLIFDRVSLKYAAFIAAGYGLTLGDIGVQSSFGSGGETLAGSIREERRARRSGRAVLLRKLRNWHNRLLPDTLEFHWIDQDDELNQGIARARLANATALGMLKNQGFIDTAEGRLQMIADHLFTITLPEKVPSDASPSEKNASLEELEEQQKESGKAGGAVGNPNPDVADQVNRPVPPSLGGHGDVKRSVEDAILRDFLYSKFKSIVDNLSEARVRRLTRTILNALLPSLQRSVSQISDEELMIETEWIDQVLDGSAEDIDNYASLLMNTVSTFVEKSSEFDPWWRIYPSDEEYHSLYSVYEAWFKKGSRHLLRSLTDYLYEIGAIDHERTPESMDITAPIIAAALLNRSKTMISVINDATRTFLNRALLSSVRRQLVETGMADLLRQGVDIETVMSNNSFISAVSRSLRERLVRDFTNRLSIIDTFEESWTVNRAILEQMSALGLQRKRWVHDDSAGDKPCEKYCQVAVDAGEVELSYKYDTAFGPVEFAPGHPGPCHCHIAFVPSEVQKQISLGEFPIHNWRGV